MLTGARLAELNVMFSDPSFQSELEKALRTGLSADAAKSVADRLAPAYNPEPRRRPSALSVWAEEVAAAFAAADEAEADVGNGDEDRRDPDAVA